MLEIITKWIIANKDSLISGFIVSSVIFGLGKFQILINNMPKAIKALAKIKGIKYLGFIVLYILPLGIMTALIVDSKNQPTDFKTSATFMIVFVTFTYNLLNRRIINLYRMIEELANKASHNDKIHKEAINILAKKSGMPELIAKDDKEKPSN